MATKNIETVSQPCAHRTCHAFLRLVLSCLSKISTHQLVTWIRDRSCNSSVSAGSGRAPIRSTIFFMRTIWIGAACSRIHNARRQSTTVMIRQTTASVSGKRTQKLPNEESGFRFSGLIKPSPAARKTPASAAVFCALSSMSADTRTVSLYESAACDCIIFRMSSRYSWAVTQAGYTKPQSEKTQFHISRGFP